MQNFGIAQKGCLLFFVSRTGRAGRARGFDIHGMRRYLCPSKNFPMALRDEFPPAGTEYLGGHSDGLVYRTAFTAKTIEQAYEMVRRFLVEEGYGDVPLPEDAATLQKFRLRTRNRQILLFEDNGYVHNPIKILFPTDARRRCTLLLEIYNEKAPNHLLRFHGKLDE